MATSPQGTPRRSRRNRAATALALLIPLVGLALLVAGPSGGAYELELGMGGSVFTVNSAGDASDSNPGNGACDTGGTVGGSPECTLRAAIEEANGLTGTDSIHFNIPVADGGYTASPVAFTIQPSGLLPAISTPMVIDASTQAEYGTAGRPVIELNGVSVLSGEKNGFWLTGGGSTIRGFVINRFGDDAIDIEFNGGNTIVGNYVGTNVTGTAAAANDWGINVKTAGNTIGGTTPADRNVVSGNVNEGVYIKNSTATGNVVTGNYIGTNAAGSGPVANGSHGIIVFNSASSNRLGGPGTGDGNVIAGNGQAGILISGGATDVNTVEGNYIGVNAAGDGLVANGNDAMRIASGADDTIVKNNLIVATNGDGLEIPGASSGTVIQGNTFGTDLGGTADWSGRYAAITLDSGASGTLIGGTVDGQGNTIANSGSNAGNPNSISILSGAGSGISILRNSMYGSRGIGIDLYPIGATANDVGDGDSGPNDLLNHPVIGSAAATDGTIIVSFDLDVPTNADQYRVEFFTNPGGSNVGGNWEGEQFVSAMVTAPGTGIVHSFAGSIGDVVTATATRIDSGSTSGFSSTSEFSTAEVVISGVVVINSTGDAVDASPGNGVCDTGGTNSAAAPECTFRAAIEETNALATLVAIDFNMPATEAGHSGGVWTIGPGSVLDDLSSSVIIDGTSQSGWTSTPVVELDGIGAGVSTSGLEVTGDDVKIRGLAVGRFTANGIRVENGAERAVIAGNHIGTDASGLVGRGNTLRGVYLNTGSGPTTVGGVTDADRNVISDNNSDGIVVRHSDGNTIIGNYIGTDTTGDAPLANTSDGISVVGTSSGNTIGQPGSGNVVSGNAQDGFELEDDLIGNVIQANMVGLGQDGTTIVANGRHGLVLYDGVNNSQIGGTSPAERNVISGNGDSGIVIDGAILTATTANTVEGNYIGTDSTGAFDRGNVNYGIEIIGGAHTNTIGGAAVGAGNVISGNGSGEGGILIDGSTSSNNIVQGNHIGTNAAGDGPLANNLSGLNIDSAPGTQILDNLISGNDAYGIDVSGAGATGTSVLRNAIGTNAAATTAIANGFDGLRLKGGSSGTTVGSPGNANIVAGNTQHGTNINSSSGNTIQANLIGTNTGKVLDLGNGFSGVFSDVLASSNNLIGGSTAGDENTIAFNAEGIRLLSGTKNALLRNSIYANDELGIDLADDGITANDVNDGDSGPNDLLNHPLITSADESGGTITIGGTFDAPAESYRFEFFTNPGGADPSGNGEGEQFASSLSLTHTGSGPEPWATTFPGSAGDVITATITEDFGGSFGSTSEFSASFTVAGPYALSGTVFEDVAGDALDDGSIGDAANPGAPSVDVHLYLDGDDDDVAEATDSFVATTQTDSNGDYSFAGLGPSNYFIVVDSKTVVPSAGFNGGFTVGDLWAEQTFGPGSARCADGLGSTTTLLAAGPCYGGRTSTGSDDLTTWHSGSEHLAGATIATGDVVDVDFGFSHNVVTVTAGGDSTDDDASANRTIQGSLRQFIQNANAVTGQNAMRFVPAEATNVTLASDSWWRIAVSAVLPVITDDATTVDGTAHDFADGVTALDPNSSGPELELDGSTATAADGLSITSSGNTLRDLVVGGFGDSFRSGVLIQGAGADNNVVAGSYIGTNGTGASANANYYGLRFAFGAGGNEAGGLVGTDRNVISGNLQDGIVITGTGSDANVVRGNYVGTIATGSSKLGNTNGISITSGALDNVIGGAGPAARNVISGNSGQGLYITSDSTKIWGNYIGTDATGTSAVRNLRGIWLGGAADSEVGSTDPSKRNVISGNSFRGLLIANSSSGTTVVGNYIGTDAFGTGSLPNYGPGVEINFSSVDNTIGGVADDAKNLIANNSGDGVLVAHAASTGNAVLGNVIYGNGGLGIDLDSDGVTANDGGDADAGPNGLLNHPTIASASAAGGVVAVQVSVDVPAGTYRLEFYSNPSGSDPSGFGEGEVEVGSATIIHGGSGSESFAVAVPAAVGDSITATVTEDLGAGSFGSTSEFGASTTVIAAGPPALDSTWRLTDLAPFGGLDPTATAAGVAGASLLFDGGADRLVGPALDFTAGQLSLSGWVNLDTLGSDPRVVAKTSTGGTAIYELLVDSATSEVVARLHVGGATREARGGLVTVGNWHHLTATWDGANLVVYVDGTAVDSATAVGHLTTDPATPVVVGNRAAGDGGLDGRIDEVEVSPRALSADRVAATEANLRNPGLFTRIGTEQTSVPAPWTVSAGTTRTGANALVAPSSPAGTNSWLTAIGIDEPGIEFESWWWLSDTATIDAAAGTRTGAVAADQYETGLSVGGWDLAAKLGATRPQQAGPTGSAVNGAWVEVIIGTDELGNSSVRLDGTQIIAPTAQTGGVVSGSVGFRAGTVEPSESWFVDDVRVRRLVSDEPTTSLGPLDRN